MIEITKDINEAKLITHSGSFHPDDVFSTVLLSKIYPNSRVIRVSKVEEEYKDKIVYDIGFGKFDHHQVDAKMRNESIKYSSFGLLWKEYGLKVCDNDQELWDRIDKKLVMQIDGIDNGNFPTIKADYELLDLDKIIDLFNNNWDSKEDNDKNFYIAVVIAEEIFDALLEREKAILKAIKIVHSKLDNLEGNILVLDEYTPYVEATFTSSKKDQVDAVIFPSKRGGYNIKPLVVSMDSYDLKKNFPEEWWGLHDEELANASGIKTARFIHSNGFIASTDTLEDAYLLASKLK